MEKKPSKKDRDILNGLKEYQDLHGYAASIRDVCMMAGTTSTSVAHYYLKRLEKLGLIARSPGISRGIIVIDKTPAETPKTSDVFHVRIRSPKARILFHSVTVLGCKMRRFPPWPEVKKLSLV